MDTLLQGCIFQKRQVKVTQVEYFVQCGQAPLTKRNIITKDIFSCQVLQRPQNRNEELDLRIDWVETFHEHFIIDADQIIWKLTERILCLFVL